MRTLYRVVMKKETIIALVCCLISIGCLITMLVRSEPFDVNSLDLLIGSASFVITAYVAVQLIYSLIVKREVDDKFKEQEKKLTEKIDTITSEKIKEYDYSVCALTVQLHTIIEFYNRSYNKEAISGFIKALDSANKSKNDDIIFGILSYIEIIKTKIKNAGGDPTLKLTDKQKAEYCMVLAQTQKEEAFSLISFIQSL